MTTKASDRLFDTANVLLLSVLAIVTIYPFVYVLVYSLNDAVDSMRGGLAVWPRKFTLGNYAVIFRYESLTDAFLMSVLRTAVGTVAAVWSTAMVAFALMRRDLVGYKAINAFFILTMFVSGGLIPTFILYKQLHLFNTFWVYIIPGLVSAFNMILMRTSFQQIPQALVESAHIDGAGDLYVFARLILPLSAPILATISLFVAVGQWNSWQDTLFYTSAERLQTLQYVLMKILSQAEAGQMINAMKLAMARKGQIRVTPDAVKMAITMVATVPILLVYPFVQKYFVKGMLLGSVKG